MLRPLPRTAAFLVTLVTAACSSGTDSSPLPFGINQRTLHCIGGPPPCTGGEPEVTTVARGDTLLFYWELVPHAGVAPITVHVRPLCAPNWEVRQGHTVVVTLPLTQPCHDSVSVISSTQLVGAQANLWIVPGNFPVGTYTVQNVQFLDPALFLTESIIVH